MTYYILSQLWPEFWIIFSDILIQFIFAQIGDFLLLHFLGQNMSMMTFGDLLEELSNKLHIDNMNNMPTAPSTMELNPIYTSDKQKLHKETEAWIRFMCFSLLLCKHSWYSQSDILLHSNFYSICHFSPSFSFSWFSFYFNFFRICLDC